MPNKKMQPCEKAAFFYQKGVKEKQNLIEQSKII